MEDTFADLLHCFRVRARLTITELAEAVGADRKSVAAWERGTRVPRDRARLLDLAQVLRLEHAETNRLTAAARHYPRRPDGTEQPALGDDAAGTQAGPAPLSAAGLRHQLRAPIGDFVGRAQETARLSAALQAAVAARCGAIISGVQGMGGVGKTELAYRVAHSLRDTFPHAQIVLNLRGSSTAPLSAEQALQAVIHAFAPDAPLPDDLEALQAHYQAVLHNQRALILADDAHDAAQVRPLLPPPGCALLITSRQRFTLPGMTIVDLDQLIEGEAVALLRAVCPRLRLPEAQAIARACGYLPLALRVSGSILRNNPALAVGEHIARLADERQRLSQLRDPDDGQLDIESSLALSYAQLDVSSQQVFRQLGVLALDFTTELALAVVAAPKGVDVTDILYLLLRRNLVIYDAARARWRLHDLVRDLALRYLEAAGELEAASWRYAHATVHLAHVMQKQYRAGWEGVLAALARFDVEHPHIEAARRWAAAHAGTPAGDMLLVDYALATASIGALRYDLRHARIRQLVDAVGAAQRLNDQRGEWQLLIQLGSVYADLGEVRQTFPYFERGLAIARAIGDRRGEEQTLNSLGIAYGLIGAFRQAMGYFEQRRGIAREIGNPLSEGETLTNLGRCYTEQGRACCAIPYFEQALAIVRALGAWHAESVTLGDLGCAYLAVGDHKPAIEAFERALEIVRAIGDRVGEGRILDDLGCYYVVMGELPRAFATFETALAILRAVGDRHSIATCCWHYGLTLARQKECAHALPLLRAAVAYKQEIGHVKAAEHATLLARVEVGEELPVELLTPVGRRICQR